MPKSAQRSPDPARDWAALYQLCQTYEQKLKDVAQSQVSRVCAGEISGLMVFWLLDWDCALP